MAGVSREELERTLRDELRQAWHSLRARHPEERFYAFGLFTTELASCLTVTASTEEGLDEATMEYVEHHGGDMQLQRASLRWNPCDSPLHREGDGLLPRSQGLRDSGPDPHEGSPEADVYVKLVFDAGIAALQSLDREGMFGQGNSRAQLVLGIWCGDQSDEERIDFVRALNPDEVTDRFIREVGQGNEAFDELGPSERTRENVRALLEQLGLRPPGESGDAGNVNGA